MTFAVGSTITINGNNYTVANTSYTQGVLNGAQNTELSITGSVTLAGASFTQSNPPAQYANGCGDDVVNAVDFDCDSCWRQNGYIEKIHWWQSESHASSQGFSNGPYKDVNNWEEALRRHGSTAERRLTKGAGRRPTLKCGGTTLAVI